LSYTSESSPAERQPPIGKICPPDMVHSILGKSFSIASRIVASLSRSPVEKGSLENASRKSPHRDKPARSSPLARTILLEPLSGLFRTTPESSTARPLRIRSGCGFELLAHATSGEHECTSPERRALVALAPRTVKHISYRRRSARSAQAACRKADVWSGEFIQKPRMHSPERAIRSAADVGQGLTFKRCWGRIPRSGTRP
jgi:hypothetical protein